MPRGSKTLPSQREKTIMRALQDVREERGISQATVAEVLGISQGQVSRLEAGVRPITLTELLTFCEVVGVSLSEVASAAGEG